MTTASRIFGELDLRDATAVIDVLQRGTEACRGAQCRRGSLDVVSARSQEQGTPASTLIATGDLHDNPLHLMRVCRAAGMEIDDRSECEPCHVTLHELIHGERLMNGLDFSYRVLARAAALKAQWPERVHVLLANHELAQMTGQEVAKDGVRCNAAFEEAVESVFSGRASFVLGAIREFVRSLPLALRIDGPRGGLLCAHSLPAPERMDRFDERILERDLNDDDYVPRTGSAHLMVWGRGHTPEQLRALGEQWGVRLFVLGHEKAELGSMVREPNAIVLNSDHERGVFARIDLCDLPNPDTISIFTLAHEQAD